MEWVLVPLGAFALVAWIVHTIVNSIRQSQQQRLLNQFQTKLLDRIGSVSELAGFLNTEAGSRFLKDLTTVNEVATPHSRILRAVQSGAVLTALAIALYLYGWFTHLFRPPTTPSSVVDAINVIATIMFGLGVGLLVSARLSYRLSDRMGLLRSDQARRDEQSLPTV